MTRASELLTGALAQALPQYEARPGQLRMAEAVFDALTQEHVLFCEAGTGTGKTLAYLLPALLCGKRVVISTATHALQDQLIAKDVPLAERVLGRSVRATVLKGLPNYLCLRRYHDFRTSPEAGKPSLGQKLNALRVFRDETQSGDVSELRSLPEGDPIVDAVRSSSDTRIGPPCAYYDECFVTRVKRAAEDAELVITNHHLFFADLALRGPHPGRVLPNYDAVIFDEAHQLEDVATLFFGLRVSQRRIQTLLRDCARLLDGDETQLLRATVADQASLAEQRFFEALLSRLNADEPRIRLDEDTFQGEVQQRYLDLDTTLLGVASSAELARADGGPRAEAWDTVQRRVQSIRDALATIVEGAPGRVTWLDNDKNARALSSSSVDLADTLQDRLFERVPSIVLTSATLTTSPERVGDSGQTSAFAFTRRRLGAIDCEAEVRELIVDSPFDFAKNALLYVPKHLPAPTQWSFIDAACAEIQRLVEASDGGAFVLTTSYRSLRQLQAKLRPALGERPLLVQGGAPKHALLSAFRRSGHAVLLATMSFWEGVDVPGHALRLVVLEKIPFSVPSDPVLQARAAALEADGHSAFNALFLPLAQMTLKQGFGRLIRTRQDRGVVALLDSRIHSKGYGQRLLGQLPPARRTVRLQDALDFLVTSAAEA